MAVITAMLTRRDTLKLALAAASPALARAEQGGIRHVDIIHHSHTDVGYTDMPSVTRDLQVRFLDSAVEACQRNPRFRWTAEALMTVDDFWHSTSARRRAALLTAVKAGQIDIMALPFNQAPFMNAFEWRQALNWISPALWRDLEPRAAMQNDVNGFPRAGAMGLLDRGISRLIMGINADSGGPPFRRPSAFWWKMPDGRRMFVWMGDHYGAAYAYLEPRVWQMGQAKAAYATLGPPRAGERLGTDEASLKASQAHFLTRLKKLEAEGYLYPRLIISYTNQWRYDNDVPFPPLAPFIDAWNKAGLTPTLRLTTATQAVEDMERAVGGSVRTLEGEWTDWWANGDASGPREVAASRLAKRYLASALSPVWGPLPASVAPRLESMTKDLCLFDEHTWGANISVSEPDALDTIAQYTEKSLLAYKPMGHAEWLLGQRARTAFSDKPVGTYLVNTAPLPYTGWARIHGLGKPPVWVQDLAPRSSLKLGEPVPASSDKPRIEHDASGWPVTALWPGMEKPLFSAGLGDFLAVTCPPPATRSTITKIHSTADASAREKMRTEALRRVPASYGATKVDETAHTLVYTQPLEHPRLSRATRTLELERRRPRARLSVKFDRLSSVSPEVLYVLSPLPLEGVLPRFSNGGVPFTPYTDQLEGSCRDYYAVDAWADYSTPDGHWFWVTRDAPLVSVGGPHTVERRTAVPEDPQRLWAMVFDNFWHTNFVANSNGAMEFVFDLLWSATPVDADALAETLSSEPVAIVNPVAAESPELLERLFKP